MTTSSRGISGQLPTVERSISVSDASSLKRSSSNGSGESSDVSGSTPFTNIIRTSAATPTPDRIVFLLIAALLLFTAVAKLWMLLTDPFADVRVGIPKGILWFSVLFEFALAFLNLRHQDVKLLSFINTVVFASFGLFATARWLLGYGSCGCSGNLEFPAWGFILVDGLVVAWCILNKARSHQAVEGGMHLLQSFQGLSPEAQGKWSCVAFALVILFSGPCSGGICTYSGPHSCRCQPDFFDPTKCKCTLIIVP